MLFSFTGTYCTFDCYNDGTYYFEYTDIPMANESGTWTYTDWTFTVITPSGNEIVAKVGTSESPVTLERDGETYTFDDNQLCFFYTSDINAELTDVFYAEASVWGVAFGGQGSYTPITPGESSGSTNSDNTDEGTTATVLVTLTTETTATGGGTMEVSFTFSDDNTWSVYNGVGYGTWSVDSDKALNLIADAGSMATFTSDVATTAEDSGDDDEETTDSTISMTVYSMVSLSFTITSEQLSTLGADTLGTCKNITVGLSTTFSSMGVTMDFYSDGTLYVNVSGIFNATGSWTLSSGSVSISISENSYISYTGSGITSDSTELALTINSNNVTFTLTEANLTALGITVDTDADDSVD